MKPESGQTETLWLATGSTPRYPALDRAAQADVCVIGAGIAGLSTAYQLAREGQKVIVLDDGRIGSGETCRTTAHLTAALDDRYWKIEQVHGAQGARLAAESHLAALNRAEAIVQTEQIDCDFERVDGYLFAAAGRSRAEHCQRMQKELEAVHRAGLVAVRLLSEAPTPGWDTGPVLCFPRQAQFHPLKFLAGLVRAIERSGGRVCENTHVDSVEGGPTVKVKTARGHTVSAGAAVVCTNSSITDYVVTHLKQAPYRTFVVAARIENDAMPHGLYWDDDDPYHYVRVAANAENGHVHLVVGGEDHKTGHRDDAAQRFHALETWTRERFPLAGEFEYRWSGQVLEPFDYLSFTGPTPDGSENVYLHSGDSGNGMTHGIMAGILLTDLIVGRENHWAQLYNPKRISLKAAPEFIRENVDVAVQFKDYVVPAEVKSVEDIPRGAGRIIRRDGTRIAAYRDDEGALHLRSAQCTHLKCIVHWNSLEKSWDCPCHGSRFDPHGKVLNGPAIGPLEKVD